MNSGLPTGTQSRFPATMISAKHPRPPATLVSWLTLISLLWLTNYNHHLAAEALFLPTNALLSTTRKGILEALPIQHEKITALSGTTMSRRTLLGQCFAVATTVPLLVVPTNPASAKPDCFADCFKNCKAIAPKDEAYCQESCRGYCEQPDREDGLSGSVSAAQGEVGILGGSFGTGTVVKGQDKPPVIMLPGLDFSSDAGKKLIGY